MTEIRGLRPEDVPALRLIHAKLGFEYPFPDLPITSVGKVACDEGGRPLCAALAVQIMEIYLLMDPEALTPAKRLELLSRMHEAMRSEVAERGYGWAQADIPPEIERSFGKRLRKLGWFRSEWTSWAIKV